jgi:hypothetical protein
MKFYEKNMWELLFPATMELQGQLLPSYLKKQQQKKIKI